MRFMVVLLLGAGLVACGGTGSAQLENDVSALRQRVQHLEQRIKRLEGGNQRGSKVKAGRAKMSKNKAVDLPGGGAVSSKAKGLKSKNKTKSKNKSKSRTRKAKVSQEADPATP